MQKVPVKLLILLGGFIGFCLAFVLALAGGSDATYALRDGAVACLFGAILFKLASQYINASLESAPPESPAARVKDSARPKPGAAV